MWSIRKVSVLPSSTATTTPFRKNSLTEFLAQFSDSVLRRHPSSRDDGSYLMVLWTQIGLRTWTQCWMITKDYVWWIVKSSKCPRRWTCYSRLMTLATRPLQLCPAAVWSIYRATLTVGPKLCSTVGSIYSSSDVTWERLHMQSPTSYQTGWKFCSTKSSRICSTLWRDSATK